MRYTNLQIGMIVAVMILSIAVGACVPVIVDGTRIAQAQEIQPTTSLDYVGGSMGGFSIDVWRLTDYDRGNVCYISRTDMECFPTR